MESPDTYWADRAALEWQIELGADTALQEEPVNRFDLTVKDAPKAEVPAPTAPAPVATLEAIDAVAVARTALKSTPSSCATT